LATGENVFQYTERRRDATVCSREKGAVAGEVIRESSSARALGTSEGPSVVEKKKRAW